MFGNALANPNVEHHDQPMRLVHFGSDLDLTLAKLEVVEQATGPKPRGLWLSDEDEEQSWTRYAGRDMGWASRVAHPYDVELAPDAKILHLDSVGGLLWFSTQHGTDEMFPGLHLPSSMTMFVDWAAVAREWDGILITPYQWSQRVSDLSWYYGWDCASGCIWNPRAVASLTRTASPLDGRAAAASS